MTTCRAPACRTTAAAMSPIGPAPVMSTSSPSTGKLSAECTALPNGSKMAATSGSVPGGWRHTLVAGTATRSAYPPSRSMPMLTVFGHSCRRPARHDRHRPHTMCPSTLTRSPTSTVSTPLPSSTTRPAISWPSTTGGRTALCAHASHDAHVQVGAADARSAARGSAPPPAARRGPAPRAATAPGQPPPSPAPASSAPPLCRAGRGRTASPHAHLGTAAVATQATHRGGRATPARAGPATAAALPGARRRTTRTRPRCRRRARTRGRGCGAASAPPRGSRSPRAPDASRRRP